MDDDYKHTEPQLPILKKRQGSRRPATRRVVPAASSTLHVHLHAAASSPTNSTPLEAHGSCMEPLMVSEKSWRRACQHQARQCMAMEFQIEQFIFQFLGLQISAPEGHLQSYSLDPYVVLTHSYGLEGAFGYWVQPKGDGSSGYIQPVCMALA
ncbi:uncharacterized protein [Triticum aestivum]|uniref:uncharacterized protein n=1 Tax=Triticum aestivum TaxID=4565 RepID=UPI001D035DE8|nr:uncharacterized protein LOC123119202 [Triticum aestivum]